MGVWIETGGRADAVSVKSVTPYVGVWIETGNPVSGCIPLLSHPTWVCGLKRSMERDDLLSLGHTLRGCVD